MKIQRIAILLLGLAWFVLASCAQPGGLDELPPLKPSPTDPEQPVDAKPASSTATSASAARTAAPGAPAQVTLPSLQNLSEDEVALRAKADLAERIGVPIDEVTVVSMLHMEFTAQAFFCQMVKERISRDAPPEIIEGQLILLAAAGGKYEYHASDSQLIFCRQQNKIRP